MSKSPVWKVILAIDTTSTLMKQNSLIYTAAEHAYFKTI